MSQMFPYEVWLPFAPDKLFTVDDFIDGDFYTKKRYMSGAPTVYSVSTR